MRMRMGKAVHIRRSFFTKNFAFTLGLMLVPILLLTLVSSLYVRRELRSEVERTSRQSLQYMSGSFDRVFQETLGYKAQFSANPRMNVHLITALSGKPLGYEESSTLRDMYNSITAISNIKAYIYSLYLSDENSDYMIVDGVRMPVKDYSDDWQAAYWKQESGVSYWAAPRSIQRYRFEEPMPVITIFQRIMYSGIMVVNLRTSYFEELLDPASMSPGQIVMVFNTGDELLVGSGPMDRLTGEQIAALLERGQRQSSFLQDGYYVSYLPSDRYGMKYLSLIPQQSVYRIPDTLVKAMLAVSAFAVVVAVVLAFFSTRSRYRQICTLLNTFELAEQGGEIPQARYRANDVYSYILESTVNTFLQQNALKLRVSQQRLALLSTRLAALQYQINPHFLFNTLQSIDIEVLRAAGRRTQANEMIGQLSDILRYSLGDPQQAICIRDEIQAVKSYVDIQHYRYGDRFLVFWDYPQDCLDSKMPRMLLQPLIENILSHGLKNTGTTLAKVRVRREGGALCFKVIDNGTGIPAARLAQIGEALARAGRPAQAQGEGEHFCIGLCNIHQRLRLSYPGNEGLRVRSREGRGTVIRFSVPADEA